MTAFANRHGTGAFRRRHLLQATDADTVVAAIEDEMHHFEITLRHDGHVVTAIEGNTVRWPWSPCLDAWHALDALVGLPIDATPTAISAWTDARQQCTHQFDLATLAIAHAARRGAGGAKRRDYRTEVPDWDHPPFHARLWRDDVLLFDWVCSYETVIEPATFAGAPMRKRFFEWCELNLDTETAEAANVLRRAAWMSPARKLDLEVYDDALSSGLKPGICYSAQPQRMPVALRNRGSLRDYGGPDAQLLA